MRDNALEGSIPSELEKLLPGLRRLNLGGNAWTGCVPPLLLDVQTTDLDYVIENYDTYGLVLCGTSANTPPSLVSAVVVGDKLTLTYNEPLDTGSQPAIEDYEVTVNDSTSEHAVDAVLVSGSTVTLTLDPAVVANDTVKVSYTRGTNPVQDSDGADAVDAHGRGGHEQDPGGPARLPERRRRRLHADADVRRGPRPVLVSPRRRHTPSR